MATNYKQVSFKEQQKCSSLQSFMTNAQPNEAMQEVNEMTTLKEEAIAYVPQTTKNIADLEVVSVDMTLQDKEGKDKQGEVFKYKALVIEGVEYRVPGKVIGDLKAVLEKKPTLKTFSVSKAGVGLSTQYTLIPLD